MLIQHSSRDAVLSRVERTWFRVKRNRSTSVVSIDFLMCTRNAMANGRSSHRRPRRSCLNRKSLATKRHKKHKTEKKAFVLFVPFCGYFQIPGMIVAQVGQRPSEVTLTCRIR